MTSNLRFMTFYITTKQSKRAAKFLTTNEHWKQEFMKINSPIYDK